MSASNLFPVESKSQGVPPTFPPPVLPSNPVAGVAASSIRQLQANQPGEAKEVKVAAKEDVNLSTLKYFVDEARGSLLASTAQLKGAKKPGSATFVDPKLTDQATEQEIKDIVEADTSSVMIAFAGGDVEDAAETLSAIPSSKFAMMIREACKLEPYVVINTRNTKLNDCILNDQNRELLEGKLKEYQRPYNDIPYGDYYKDFSVISFEHLSEITKFVEQFKEKSEDNIKLDITIQQPEKERASLKATIKYSLMELPADKANDLYMYLIDLSHLFYAPSTLGQHWRTRKIDYTASERRDIAVCAAGQIVLRNQKKNGSELAQSVQAVVPLPRQSAAPLPSQPALSAAAKEFVPSPSKAPVIVQDANGKLKLKPQFGAVAIVNQDNPEPPSSLKRALKEIRMKNPEAWKVEVAREGIYEVLKISFTSRSAAQKFLEMGNDRGRVRDKIPRSELGFPLTTPVVTIRGDEVQKLMDIFDLTTHGRGGHSMWDAMVFNARFEDDHSDDENAPAERVRQAFIKSGDNARYVNVTADRETKTLIISFDTEQDAEKCKKRIATANSGMKILGNALHISGEEIDETLFIHDVSTHGSNAVPMFQKLLEIAERKQARAKGAPVVQKLQESVRLGEANAAVEEIKKAFIANGDQLKDVRFVFSRHHVVLSFATDAEAEKCRKRITYVDNSQMIKHNNSLYIPTSEAVDILTFHDIPGVPMIQRLAESEELKQQVSMTVSEKDVFIRLNSLFNDVVYVKLSKNEQSQPTFMIGISKVATLGCFALSELFRDIGAVGCVARDTHYIAEGFTVSLTEEKAKKLLQSIGFASDMFQQLQAEHAQVPQGHGAAPRPSH